MGGRLGKYGVEVTVGCNGWVWIGRPERWSGSGVVGVAPLERGWQCGQFGGKITVIRAVLTEIWYNCILWEMGWQWLGGSGTV
jgi:exosome complex RNA-binding protein Rrp4